MAIVALDLDGLKRTNDRHGHGAGDRAHRAVAETRGETLRTSDIGARVGGDADAQSPPALLAATSRSAW
jgi:diguanylate cyclase (GGDEF)-like protein